jgi:tetratricopeptide (TPR) repeat protein
MLLCGRESLLRPGRQHAARLIGSTNTHSGRSSMKHRQKMNAFVSMLFLSIVHILTLTVPARGEDPTQLLRLRRGVQKTSAVTFTRLVFELKGQHPTSIERVPPDKLAISFQALQSKLDPQIPISDPASPVTAINILDGGNGSRVLVQFRTPDCVVSHSFLPPETPNPGAYRLLVDVLPPPKKKTPESSTKEPRELKAAAIVAEKPAEPPRTEAAAGKPKGQESPIKGSKGTVSPPEKLVEAIPAEPATLKKEAEPLKVREVAEASLSEPLREANRLLVKGDYEQAFTEYSRLLTAAELSKEETSIALYGLADSFFFLHQQDLERATKEAATNYLKAITADPFLIQAGWAYHRLGLAYQTSGDQEKALKAFEKALEDYPKHPAAALCWLELGSAYLKAGSHGHAVRAFRAALELPLDQAQQIKASWLLGVALHGMAEYGPAIEAFERCLKKDPDWHLKQPLLLKNLGESYFFQKEYDKSRDMLLWYLNLQPEAPDRDLVLAKIAEIFTAQDQPEYAAKLFAHIQSNYPDSEGDVIAQIRKMESLKTKGRLSLEDDLTFFRELAQKPLSPQLTRLIHLKLASREHEYGNYDTSLSVIDYNLKGISSPVANPEFLALRAKVVTDWLKSAFKNRDYGTAVLLYENNQSTFANANNADLNLMIADSYLGIKQPQKAIALYEQVLAKQGPAAQNELFARMAEAAFMAKDFERAEKACSQIQGSQFQPKKKLLMAQLHFSQRDYGKVVECLSSLPETDIPATGSPSLYSIYGVSLAQLGECERATPWLHKSSEQMEKTNTHSDELLHDYMVQAACFGKQGKQQKAIAVLEEAATIAGTDHQRDQLQYDISKRYLELGQTEMAIQKLTKLMSSNQSFWKTAAKQQLDYIQMERK